MAGGRTRLTLFPPAVSARFQAPPAPRRLARQPLKAQSPDSGGAPVWEPWSRSAGSADVCGQWPESCRVDMVVGHRRPWPS